MVEVAVCEGITASSLVSCEGAEAPGQQPQECTILDTDPAALLGPSDIAVMANI